MRTIDGNGGVFGQNGLGGGEDGMYLEDLTGHTVIQNGIIRNCHVENLGDPLTSYSTKNGDCGQLERTKPGPLSLFIEDTYLGGASDSCWDVKGSSSHPVVAFFRNVTFGPAHRALRVWENATVYHQSCTWLPGSNHNIWKQDASAKVIELPS
ncbi:MAG: hypothetical protein ACR2RE_13010 [Geminicoccaceae bacterium]